MSTRSQTAFATTLLALVAALMLVAGCNSATDDPETSENLVTVASFNPTEACVDYDGELEDIDGDGTDEVVFVSTENDVNFDSRVRGASSGDFQDLIFHTVDVTYDLENGPIGNPPDRLGEAFNVTVPANGTATAGFTTVLADDIITGYFDGATRGNIHFVFKGEDASGEPYETEGSLVIRSVSVCEGT